MRIRGEVCVGAGSLLAITAVLLLIFAHIGQINTSSVPRNVAIVSVDVAAYGLGLAASTNDDTIGLYANATNVTLAQHLGLPQKYKWGLYSYCAYVIPADGVCSNTTLATQFRPGTAIVLDAPDLYSLTTQHLIPRLIAVDSSNSSVAAYYLVLVGSILAFLSVFFGFVRSSLTFLLAAVSAVLSALCLIVAAALWTTLIHKAQVYNSSTIGSTPLGILVQYETGFWLLWASAAAMFVSILPYLVSCCTFRR